MAETPFDNRFWSGFVVDGDLGAPARSVRRREKNAFLDMSLPGRCFEEPASPVWQNAKHGTAFANALQAHVRMDVKSQGERMPFDRLACRGGAQAIAPVERPAVLAQQKAALVNDAEPWLVTIMREHGPCSRRLVVALDIDFVRTRDDLVAKPFVQPHMRRKTARGDVI